MTTRQILKRSVKTAFLVFMLPVYALYRALGLTGNVDGTFMSFSQALSLIPGKLGIYMRAAFYRLACTDTSDEISVGFLTIFSHRDTTIYPGVYIGPQCNIGKCTIGENTLIGSGVHILSGSRQHEFQDIQKPIQDQGGVFEKIRIGADCWLGNASLVIANLEDHSILASGSVLTKPSAKGDIMVGNPAKCINNRFQPKPPSSLESIKDAK
jgi:acetyltransferase-like isoleucine patch superfamily enzyme